MFDLFFPKRCLGCGQEGKYFCPQCQEGIKTLSYQISPVDSIFPYNGLIKKANEKLKNGFITDLADELVKLVLKIIDQEK
jgi:predicted amidophosphoribosyltransferase